MADLTGTPVSHSNLQQTRAPSQENWTFYKIFIGLLTTVHFFSVPTAFATYFGVIQSGWLASPLYSLVGHADGISSTVYKPNSFNIRAV